MVAVMVMNIKAKGMSGVALFGRNAMAYKLVKLRRVSVGMVGVVASIIRPWIHLRCVKISFLLQMRLQRHVIILFRLWKATVLFGMRWQIHLTGKSRPESRHITAGTLMVAGSV